MRAFWGLGFNVGDTLTPIILKRFTRYRAEWVPSTMPNKLLLCGSILEFAVPGDTILGVGHYRKKKINLEGLNVLALRGRHSGKAPAYGDTSLLLPLIYNPKIFKTKNIGYIPHIWDKVNYDEYIDIELPWKSFVRKVLQCEMVISSSLHGFIIAQAYGVHAEWRHYKKIPGARIKYEDYLSGIKDGIPQAQEELLGALQRL